MNDRNGTLQAGARPSESGDTLDLHLVAPSLTTSSILHVVLSLVLKQVGLAARRSIV